MARHVEEERRSLTEARAHLSDVFKALAAEALSGSSQSFLRLAEEKFKALREEATGDLDARRQAIAALVTPLNQALDVYQREARELASDAHGRRPNALPSAVTASTSSPPRVPLRNGSTLTVSLSPGFTVEGRQPKL